MAANPPNYAVRYFWSALFGSGALAALVRGNLAVAAALLVPAALILLRAVYLRHSSGTQVGADEAHHAWIVLLTAGLLCLCLGWVTLGFLLAGPAIAAIIRDWWTWLRPKPGRRAEPQQRRCARCDRKQARHCPSCGRRI